MNVKELDREYIAGTYARFPVVLTHGSGSLVYDEAGKEYIDMGSGIAVNAFGVADGEWISAVTAQLGKLQHSSNLYFTEPGALLAEQLCSPHRHEEGLLRQLRRGGQRVRHKVQRASTPRINTARTGAIRL